MRIRRALGVLTLLALLSLAQARASVLPQKPTLRVFAAYSYFGADAEDRLPFGAGNARGVVDAFSRGARLTGSSILANPSKAVLLKGIQDCFRGMGPGETAVVYLCSHGHMTGGGEGYRLSLRGYTDAESPESLYLTSQELFNALSAIPGRVVMILDSCYSGVFIHDVKDDLDAEGGRVSVLAAATDTRASYCVAPDPGDGLDIYTFFLLRGLGDGLPADADGDGGVTPKPIPA